MSWLRFWKQDEGTSEEAAEPDPRETARPAGVRLTMNQRPLPPHLATLQGGAGSRPRLDGGALIAQLRHRRQDVLYEIEQGELAAGDENPWTERTELLTEALATVEDDIKALDNAPSQPYASLPETPITDIVVETGEPPNVSFTIAGQAFRYSEDLDWAERGHQVIRTELVRRAGDPAALVPAETPDELKPALAAHLTESLFAFASDLRDRALDGETLPTQPTLADLGRPCPDCGGWMEWGGVCQACARRKAERFRLMSERNDLLGKRAREADERSRLIERLPVARRRLADIDTEIAAVERKLAAQER